jgi:hypothetical protein
MNQRRRSSREIASRWIPAAFAEIAKAGAVARLLRKVRLEDSFTPVIGPLFMRDLQHLLTKMK